MADVVGIARRRWVEVGELGGVDLPEHDGTCPFQGEHDFRIGVGGCRTGARMAVGAGRQAFDIDDVLDRHRHPMQWPAATALRRLALALVRRRERPLGVDLAPGLNVRVGCPNAIEIALHQRDRRKSPAGDLFGKIADAPRIGGKVNIRALHGASRAWVRWEPALTRTWPICAEICGWCPPQSPFNISFPWRRLCDGSLQRQGWHPRETVRCSRTGEARWQRCGWFPRWPAAASSPYLQRHSKRP